MNSRLLTLIPAAVGLPAASCRSDCEHGPHPAAPVAAAAADRTDPAPGAGPRGGGAPVRQGLHLDTGPAGRPGHRGLVRAAEPAGVVPGALRRPGGMSNPRLPDVLLDEGASLAQPGPGLAPLR